MAKTKNGFLLLDIFVTGEICHSQGVFDILTAALKTKNFKNWTQTDLGQTPDPLLTRFSLSLASILNHQALFFQNMCLIQLLPFLLPLPLFIPPTPLPSTTEIDLWPASLFPLLLLAFHGPYYNKIIFLFKVNHTLHSLTQTLQCFSTCLESSPNPWPWLQGPCDPTSGPAASLSPSHYNLTTVALG